MAITGATLVAERERVSSGGIGGEKQDGVLLHCRSRRRGLLRWVRFVLAVLAIASFATGQGSRDATAMMNDAWITSQIHAKFFLDPDIKGRNINVDTTAGSPG